MVWQSQVYASLNINCHHQITFTKFDLRVYYPFLCKWINWPYSCLDTELIKITTECFYWKTVLFMTGVVKEWVHWPKQFLIPWATSFLMKQKYLMVWPNPGWNIKFRMSLNKRRSYRRNCKIKKTTKCISLFHWKNLMWCHNVYVVIPYWKHTCLP